QHLIGYKEKDEGQHDEGTYTFAVHGAAMMVPMSVIKELGPMDDIFFLYYEEHDWCERIKRAGYKIYYEPKSLIWHKESISTGRNSTLKAYYITRNRILFARRNCKASTKWISLLYLYFLVPVKFTLSLLLKRQFDLLLASWKGTIWNYFHSSGRKNLVRKSKTLN
ncbi:MAG: glycosyltransferase family 2 protein, partial [Bacteroidales bacterium]|nr:glycosyltransferase family 2 protein [Bacteroidales bacterium]